MPGEGGVRRRGRRPAQLGRHVVVAAGGREHDRRLPAHGPGERVVGGGVAGVQRQHDVGGRVDHDVADGAHGEGHLLVDAERGGDLAVVVGRLLLHVGPHEVHREPARVGEEPVGGEGQVGVAAPEVDHAQRLVGRRPAQRTTRPGVGERRVELAQELLDLAQLGLPAGLDPALGVGEPERPEHRVGLLEQAFLVAVVPALGLHGLLAGRRVQQPLALLGHSQLVGVRGRLDVPVAERLVEEQRVQRLGRRARGRLVAEEVVAGVRLRRVVRRQLQVPAGLEVHGADLDAAPARLALAAAARGHRTDQRVGGEDLGPQAGEGTQQRLGHGRLRRWRRRRRSAAGSPARRG